MFLTDPPLLPGEMGLYVTLECHNFILITWVQYKERKAYLEAVLYEIFVLFLVFLKTQIKSDPVQSFKLYKGHVSLASSQLYCQRSFNVVAIPEAIR